jgi:uncharacterized protein (TIGR02145 family)
MRGKFIYLIIALLLYSITSFSQISIGDSLPDSSAVLDIQSTDRGLLVPRMTTAQMNAIADPEMGLVIFNTTVNTVFYYDGTGWNMFGDNTGGSCGDVTHGGYTYQTIVIGPQCWMTENLNIGKRVDGANNQADNGKVEKYCYNDDPGNCDTYGGLYQWWEMMDYLATEGTQGICPAGWHIPTDEEWKILEGTVDSLYAVGDPEWDGNGFRGYDVGLSLKAASGWNSGGDGTDSFGFAALPGGLKSTGGGFEDIGDVGHWWTSTQDQAGFSRYRLLDHAYDESGRSTNGNGFGYSVRCIKN